jgi:hypothetical protein
MKALGPGTGSLGEDKRTQTDLCTLRTILAMNRSDEKIAQIINSQQLKQVELIQGRSKIFKIGESDDCRIYLPGYLDQLRAEPFQLEVLWDGNDLFLYTPVGTPFYNELLDNSHRYIRLGPGDITRVPLIKTPEFGFLGSTTKKKKTPHQIQAGFIIEHMRY